MSLTILCDMDGILADLQMAVIRRYNQTHDTAMMLEDIDNWDYSKCSNIQDAEDITEWFREPDFFENLAPIPGARLHLERIAQNHRVILLSSPSGPHSAAAKIRWVKEHFPFIPERDIMLAHHKNMVKADVLIDDSPINLASYKEAWPDALTVGIAYPYNTEAEPDFMAQSAQEPEVAWAQIEAVIAGFAKR